MSFDWKATLATVAPTIATALGGPVAGIAANVALKALNLEPSGNPVADNETLSNVLSAGVGDPELLSKLRKAEADFKIELKRLDVDLERIHAGDRADARGLAKAKGLHVQAVLSAVFVVGYFGIFALLLQQFFGDNPVVLSKEALTIISLLLGVMTAAVKDIMQFWFGSSAGSKEKTIAMGTK